jgi:hypothetical protein
MTISMFTVPIRYSSDEFDLLQVAKLAARMQLVVTVAKGQPVIGVLVTPEPEAKKKRSRR